MTPTKITHFWPPAIESKVERSTFALLDTDAAGPSRPSVQKCRYVLFINIFYGANTFGSYEAHFYDTNENQKLDFCIY